MFLLEHNGDPINQLGLEKWSIDLVNHFWMEMVLTFIGRKVNDSENSKNDTKWNVGFKGEFHPGTNYGKRL